MNWDKEGMKFSASPQEAENFYLSFQESYQNKIGKPLACNKDNENLIKIFGNSRFLCNFLINNPDASNVYTQSKYKYQEKDLQSHLADLQSCLKTRGNSLDTLKYYKYQEYLRLTIKELMGVNQMENYSEFSSLAYVITQTLVEKHLSELLNQYDLKKDDVSDFSLIAMGKLGGNALNYSSDIDLIGFYEHDGEHKNITNHEFYTKLFERLTKDLQALDQNGFLFRVDWDLRPEGKSGTLANSLRAMEEYYETFGEEWERQAFIKARVMYQTDSVGDRFLKIMKPFVYRKLFDEKTVKNIWEMKKRIHHDLKSKPRKGINIKLDEGGIRDIEFFIQGFQLLHGGQHKELQNQSTLKSLHELEKLKLIKEGQADVLKKSYLFLRKLESCIQMDDERQSHVYPNNPEDEEKIARRMAYTNENNSAVEFLREDLENIRENVKDIFTKTYGSE